MVELELEINQRTGEWNTLQESSSELRPLHGPALTGLNNLGNSCYINSVMQVTLLEIYQRTAEWNSNKKIFREILKLN